MGHSEFLVPTTVMVDWALKTNNQSINHLIKTVPHAKVKFLAVLKKIQGTRQDDIRKNLFEQHFQRINVKILFSDVNQIRTEQLNNYVPVKGVHYRRYKKVAPLSSTRFFMSYMRVTKMQTREREQSLLVWLNNEMDAGQSVLVKSCVIFRISSHSRCQRSKI